jgi:hypothetical protein
MQNTNINSFPVFLFYLNTQRPNMKTICTSSTSVDWQPYSCTIACNCRWTVANKTLSIFMTKFNVFYTDKVQCFYRQSSMCVWHRIDTYTEFLIVYPLFCARVRQVTSLHPILDGQGVALTARGTCRAHKVNHFSRLPEKKWVRENVSFRSVYDGQLQLCM